MNMGEETNVNKSRGVAFDNNIKPVEDECRICLESLVDDRTPVKLRCGHQYHLDCIGSAFNIKNKMQCPTCKRVEQGQWLFARSSPSPDFNVPLVQPLMAGLPAPVWRESMFSSVGRQLGRILPNSARSTSSASFNVPRRESSVELTQQQQIARNISRTLAANEHRIHRTMYGYDIRSSGGSYSRGRGSSRGGGSSAEGMSTAEMATMKKTIATASGGDTSRSGGSKQFRPMA